MLHNKLEKNFHLSNKKAMFFNLRRYYEVTNRDPFEYLPLTYHVRNGTDDQEYLKFESQFQKNKLDRSCKNLWIVKPGENTN